MADGDIVTASFRINGAVDANDSTAVEPQLTALFPVAEYDILTTSVLAETGSGGKYKARIVVTARAIA